jgi:CDP-diacylglycerol--glycerol-3-phosphate 3-phosphatidyltransferase
MALAPVFMALFVTDNVWSRFWAMIIFIIAALTDLYDGYYARKYGATTSFGKFADPLADKILVSVAFIAFVTLGYVAMWMVLAIIIREFLITGLRALAAYKGVVIAPTRWAKIKTFLQMTAIALILVVINLRTFCPAAGIDLPLLESPATTTFIFWLMLVTVVVTLATGVDYIVKSYYLLKNALR